MSVRPGIHVQWIASHVDLCLKEATDKVAKAREKDAAVFVRGEELPFEELAKKIRGEADTLPRPPDNGTIKDVVWRHFSVRTVTTLSISFHTFHIYPHTFKVGDSQPFNCLRYVSIFIDFTDLKLSLIDGYLSLDFVTAFASKRVRWYELSLFSSLVSFES
ncbi:hypothetical protein AVEN_198469-1 [Araneus ventricosus]|uniref:Uncharacterized protein n=1 Tax=Araneus ventricosus TaxID=182803 RepID=A0A4Y2EQU1_ARAVE|nr:hypothetical protein AVEN_198469-1 [Araneus ventricosus]